MPHQKPRFLPWILSGLILSVCVVAGAMVAARVLGPGNKGSSSSQVSETPWPDPRLAYKGPYENVRPNIKYVGDKVCAGCHHDECEKFSRHPMGQSAFLPEDVMDELPIDKDHHNPFDLAGIQYRVVHEQDDKDDKHRAVYHEERLLDPRDKDHVLATIKKKIALVIGSGVHGRTYVVEENGYLLESPISWFHKKDKEFWDISPGYEFRTATQFSRVIPNGCMFCHVNHVDAVPGTVNRYNGDVFQGSIGCERCHGPGELHVKKRKETPFMEGLDSTIVNPKDLSIDLREAVCQQCHLQTGITPVLRPSVNMFDFRPGMPVQEFFDVFLQLEPKEETFKSVGQVQQMYSSKCFKLSRLKDPEKGMGCISCHDPHWAPPADKVVGHYRKGCLKCHGEKGGAPDCSVPVSERTKEQPDDSCFECHMPKKPTKDVVHASLTDHRVLRATDKPPPLFRPKSADLEMMIGAFHADLTDPYDQAARRSLAIACMDMLDEARVRREQLPQAKIQTVMTLTGAWLSRIVAEHPDDIEAAYAQARFLSHSNHLDDAVKVMVHLVERQPDDENALSHTSDIAARAGNEYRDLAIKYRRLAIAKNPNVINYRTRLLAMVYEEHDWPGVIEQCEFILRWQLNDVVIQKKYIEALVKSGQKSRGEQAFNFLLKSQPEDQQRSLQDWWGRL